MLHDLIVWDAYFGPMDGSVNEVHCNYVCVCVCMRLCVHAFVCVHLCLCACMRVCL